MPRAKGERRLEILKALAQMLEQPKWEKITTAALAEKLDVSEAALYRHFASKAQMYEGLIEFIESSVFTLANKISADEADGELQASKLVEMLPYAPVADQFVGIFHLINTALTDFVIQALISPILAHLSMDKILIDGGQIRREDLIE